MGLIYDRVCFCKICDLTYNTKLSVYSTSMWRHRKKPMVHFPICGACFLKRPYFKLKLMGVSFGHSFHTFKLKERMVIRDTNPILRAEGKVGMQFPGFKGKKITIHSVFWSSVFSILYKWRII